MVHDVFDNTAHEARLRRLSEAEMTYDEKVRVLSEGSVNLKFDAFLDIPWDDPAYAIEECDARMVLPATQLMGGHPWYQALPLERQVEIGTWYQAQICKTGLHFENLLIRGLMGYVFNLPNGQEEFRYATHEATEETHHTQMFQEFVNRSGVNPPGLRRWLASLHHIIPMFSTIQPDFFFMMVLSGEEPIDHMQKDLLGTVADEMHPLVHRIMEIHVAEEARHISFAHELLARRSEEYGVIRRTLLSLLLPVIMRISVGVMMKPPAKSVRQLGIPREVMREVYWDSPRSKEYLQDVFADVRLLAERMGLLTPVGRLAWRALGVSGRPSRFRGEGRDRAIQR